MTGHRRDTAELMDPMRNCKIICRVGTGVDAIDIPAATERGIWVTNVPDYSIDEVSTHAIALVLAQVRHLFPHRKPGRDRPSGATGPTRRSCVCRTRHWASSVSAGSARHRPAKASGSACG